MIEVIYTELSKEDLKFLKSLGHKLLTQSNDGNADPVFWGIRDYKDVLTPDGHYIIILDDCEVIFDEYKDDINDLKEYLLSNTDTQNEDIVEADLLDIIDFIEESDLDYQIYHYDKVPYLLDNTGAFLTKEAALTHLKDNKHHYTDKVHTYAMTAWRNPEFEQLINILKKLGGDTEDEEI